MGNPARVRFSLSQESCNNALISVIDFLKIDFLADGGPFNIVYLLNENVFLKKIPGTICESKLAYRYTVDFWLYFSTAP